MYDELRPRAPLVQRGTRPATTPVQAPLPAPVPAVAPPPHVVVIHQPPLQQPQPVQRPSGGNGVRYTPISGYLSPQGLLLMAIAAAILLALVFLFIMGIAYAHRMGWV